MYADKQTAAMRAALGETDRRRAIQVAYNEEHGITPETIVKGISDIAEFLQSESKVPRSRRRRQRPEGSMPPAEIEKTIVELEEEMLAAAEDLRFEYAAKLRDEIRDLKRELDVACRRDEPASEPRRASRMRGRRREPASTMAGRDDASSPGTRDAPRGSGDPGDQRRGRRAVVQRSWQSGRLAPSSPKSPERLLWRWNDRASRRKTFRSGAGATTRMPLTRT